MAVSYVKSTIDFTAQAVAANYFMHNFNSIGYTSAGFFFISLCSGIQSKCRCMTPLYWHNQRFSRTPILFIVLHNCLLLCKYIYQIILRLAFEYTSLPQFSWDIPVLAKCLTDRTFIPQPKFADKWYPKSV